MLDSSFDWSAGMRGSFTWADYLVFVGMLVASLAIGIFYAIKSRNKANDEFLLGSRSLSCFPVSMSLLASYISAILVLGGPSEAYYHGVQWWVICAGQFALPLSAVVFMPFFYELKLTSVYEGGMKAVVWTDVLQLFILILGLIAVIIKGLIDMGSFQRVWEISVQHDRAGPQIFTYGYDPMERHTVANIVVSALVGKVAQYSCTQTTIQRYVSMKSLTHAYMSIFMVIPFFILLISLTMITGLVMFATYEGCDPLAAGLITKKDQILPFYVMDRLSSVPGLPGLFVACIFSGALSTISSGVNSQAAVTWEDAFANIPRFAKLTSATQALLTKFLALGYGFLAVGLAFLAGNLGGVLQAAIAVTSSVAGPLLAVFIMALFMPFTNSKGACSALVLGTAVALSFSFGATILGIKPEILPTSTDACPANLTIPLPSDTHPVRVSDLQYPQKIFGLSYTQLGPLGLVVGLVVGVLVSFLTGKSGGRRVERSLVHPWVRWSLPDPADVTARTKANSYDNKMSTNF
ncbi:sodium-coupled monocarboxylate transporter 1-like isoform X2 [Cherax quadricarinatus]|uniref:sodium-coupled monocarboxylate transporter 1-like isoform X2 n=1 Tax=Cherax quadricarinatus TaxID=27406 RepID=UPI00387EB624